MSELKLTANAKINLGLEVLGKRPDGFHSINTVLYRISLADTIRISPDDNLLLETEPETNIQNNENLVFRAAELLKLHFPDLAKGAKIQLKKQIPVGAGLGGGSSDAASTLLGLACLWRIPIKTKELEKFALMLGCDVPFFFYDKCAIARRKGDLLNYIDFRLPYHILIVYPNVMVSTAEAYGNLKIKNNNNKPFDFAGALVKSLTKPELMKELIFNDFEDYVFNKHRFIEEIKNEMYNTGAVFALLSGSGSSVYGLFRTSEDAENAKAKFADFFTYICIP